MLLYQSYDPSNQPTQKIWQQLNYPTDQHDSLIWL